MAFTHNMTIRPALGGTVPGFRALCPAVAQKIQKCPALGKADPWPLYSTKEERVFIYHNQKHC